MERLSHNHSDESNELLSAYIDGAVDAAERRRAERLIDSCAACAQEVQELRMFRQLLRDLPNVQPRRSFTLDPATVAPPRRLLFPTLRWSSLVAAALFLVVLGVDVLGVVGSPSMKISSAPGAAQGSPAAAPELSSEAAGGSAETMELPQASPAASAPPSDAQAAESAPAVANAPTSVASDALPEASQAAGAYPPAARNESSDAAGGTAAGQLPQPQFRADQPAGADTLAFDQSGSAEGSWWSSYTLRIVELVLGVIALLLGGAALWAWRRQV
jgi:anti-sigma factor RsiW